MDIHAVEIFATGRHNDVKTFTTVDLDAIVESFERLGLAKRVPLKFGHNEEQPFTDGQPALGWVARVWRDGDKLLADFIGLPRAVFDAVQAGLYKFVSVELLRDVMAQGSEFPWVLSAVALLGADIPAVSGLRDLQALATARMIAFRSGARLTFTQDVSKSGGRKTMAEDKDKPDLTALIAKMDELSGKVSTFSQENATLKADNERLKSEAKTREDASKAEKVASHRAAIKARFDVAAKAHVILPRTQELFEKQPAFTSDDSVLTLTLDFVDSYIKEHKVEGKHPVDRGSGGGGEHVTEDEDIEGLDPREAMRKLTFAKIQKSGGKLQYFAAARLVARENPELAEKYRLAPGVYDSKGGRAA